MNCPKCGEPYSPGNPVHVCLGKKEAVTSKQESDEAYKVWLRANAFGEGIGQAAAFRAGFDAARAAVETSAPRSVEGLQTYPYREGELQPVKPVLGTPNEISDTTLVNLIKYEPQHSNFCALVELWERRGAVKSNGERDG